MCAYIQKVGAFTSTQIFGPIVIEKWQPAVFFFFPSSNNCWCILDIKKCIALVQAVIIVWVYKGVCPHSQNFGVEITQLFFFVFVCTENKSTVEIFSPSLLLSFPLAAKNAVNTCMRHALRTGISITAESQKSNSTEAWHTVSLYSNKLISLT